MYINAKTNDGLLAMDSPVCRILHSKNAEPEISAAK
jgi:hypothetical protein